MHNCGSDFGEERGAIGVDIVSFASLFCCVFREFYDRNIRDELSDDMLIDDDKDKLVFSVNPNNFWEKSCWCPKRASRCFERIVLHLFHPFHENMLIPQNTFPLECCELANPPTPITSPEAVYQASRIFDHHLR